MRYCVGPGLRTWLRMMKELFDTDSVEVVKEGITVGRTDVDKGTVCHMRFAPPSRTNTSCVMRCTEGQGLLGQAVDQRCLRWNVARVACFRIFPAPAGI